MKSIFIVEAGVDYEGSHPVRAFVDEYDAKEYARECTEHLAKRPKFPETVTAESCEQWRNAEAAWSSAHEAGQCGSPDWFRCVEVPFGPVAQEAAEQKGGE